MNVSFRGLGRLLALSLDILSSGSAQFAQKKPKRKNTILYGNYNLRLLDYV